jgi:uncharacterized membrane protein
MGRLSIEGVVQQWLLMSAAVVCMAVAHLIQPARQGIWLLPYIDFSGVSVVIGSLAFVRSVVSVMAAELAVLGMLPAGVVLRAIALFSVGAAVRLERREFARKYRQAQRGQR